MMSTCANQKLMTEIAPIPWVLTDFAILLCPIPMIKKLQLRHDKRVILYAIFLLGGL